MDDLWVRKPAPVRAVRWHKPGDARCFSTLVIEHSDPPYFRLPGAGYGDPGDWIIEIGAGQLVRMLDADFTHLYERHDYRPSFTLKPSDPLTPDTVRFWIARAEASGVPEHKIESARTVIEQIERAPGPRHMPD